MPITYLRGDATCPVASGAKIIAHVANDAAKWGRGFVMAVSAKWPGPREFYLRAHRLGLENSKLGGVQLVEVRRGLCVASMVAQRGTKTGSSGPPIRYDALATCLEKVAAEARRLGASVHMPRIGCGLAGGRWDRVEPILAQALGGVPVFVYDLGSGR